MEDLTSYAIELSKDDLIRQIAIYVLATRAFFKPLFSFWKRYISPYISIKPTEKLLKNPIYLALVYILDWTSSIKLPVKGKK